VPWGSTLTTTTGFVVTNERRPVASGNWDSGSKLRKPSCEMANVWFVTARTPFFSRSTNMVTRVSL